MDDYISTFADSTSRTYLEKQSKGRLYIPALNSPLKNTGKVRLSAAITRNSNSPRELAAFWRGGVTHNEIDLDWATRGQPEALNDPAKTTVSWFLAFSA